MRAGEVLAKVLSRFTFGLRWKRMRDIDKATILKCSDVFNNCIFNIRDKRAGLHERDVYEGCLV